MKMVEKSAIRGMHRHLLPQLKNQQAAELRGHAAPSVNFIQEPSGSRTQGMAPPGDRREKLYSTAQGNRIQQQHFKKTDKYKENLSAEAIKGILKSKINPTDIKVGINSFKSFTDGRVQITTSRKE
jgi:hypothetical protein